MAQRVTHPAPVSSTAPRRLARIRLLLGAVGAAAGLFLAFHWVGLPGAQLSLNHNRHRTDSVAALEQTAASPGRQDARGRHSAGGPRTALQRRAAKKGHLGGVTASAPRKAGKPIRPGTRKQPPGSTPPAGSVGTDDSTQEAGTTVLPPPSLPPPTSLPVEIPTIPELPQLPQLPQVPQVPVPTVPDLPKLQVPSMPTPQLPKLP